MATASPDSASPKNPESLRREIEATRIRLGTNLDQLTEKLSPKRVVEREAHAAVAGLTGLAGRVASVGRAMSAPPCAVTHRVARTAAQTATQTAARTTRIATGTATAVIGLTWAFAGQPAWTATSKAGGTAGQAVKTVRTRLSHLVQVE